MGKTFQSRAGSHTGEPVVRGAICQHLLVLIEGYDLGCLIEQKHVLFTGVSIHTFLGVVSVCNNVSFCFGLQYVAQQPCLNSRKPSRIPLCYHLSVFGRGMGPHVSFLSFSNQWSWLIFSRVPWEICCLPTLVFSSNCKHHQWNITLLTYY